jgi:hypothetical protein
LAEELSFESLAAPLLGDVPSAKSVVADCRLDIEGLAIRGTLVKRRRRGKSDACKVSAQGHRRAPAAEHRLIRCCVGNLALKRGFGHVSFLRLLLICCRCSGTNSVAIHSMQHKHSPNRLPLETMT